jgi:hypothetical protein
MIPMDKLEKFARESKKCNKLVYLILARYEVITIIPNQFYFMYAMHEMCVYIFNYVSACMRCMLNMF